MFKNMRIGTKIALSISALMIIIFVAFTSLIVSKARESSIQQAHNLAEEMAGRYGNEIKGIIEKALDASWAGAAAMQSITKFKANVDREMVNDFIKTLTEADTMFFGTQIVIEANELDGRDADFIGNDKYGPKGEYGQYGWYEGSTWKLAEMHKNDPNNTRAWYMVPRDTGKAVLTEPYTTSVVPEVMATVSVPILKSGKFIGVVGIDFVLGSFEKMVKDIHPMETGYAFITSNEGYCVAHPDKEIVTKSIAEAFPEANRNEILNDIKNGKTYHNTLVSPRDGKEYYYVFEPVVISGTTTPWSIGLAIPTDKIYAEANNFFKLIVTISILAIILVIGVVLLIARSISKPIGVMVQDAQSIAEGNFETKMDRSLFGGELLTLHDALRSMVENLVKFISTAEEKSKEAEQQTEAANEALEEARLAKEAAERAKAEGMLQAARELEGIVEQITSASEELSSQIEESARGSETQRERTSESATAMEQMNASVLEVAQNASQAAESALDAKKNAEDGGRIVADVVSSIDSVSKASSKMVNGLNELGTQAEGISQVITVITDIADQTNLLALNAAIEAARAGEAGRGFAVVADEVRKLAEKTMQATQEVEQAVHAIQSETRRNIDEMNNAANMVAKSTEYAGKAGESLETIVENVDSTADQVRAIATASEEQSAASEQINRGTDEVNRIAMETAEAMHQSMTAVSDLARLSGDLQKLIDDLKDV
ncbi:methyl-accepting chemotaxis protein [Maridesulfovibrio salexigens]|uniref:Methyl-accepting chemotaxis sensory transducer with Cache sensor n=1 Tax=Maridesulfovibrio salexigens (strain ATCC 14822 / DSM 2638 / NCIMB 8403 / VKM B-1763) TaxID=526222 RepID=C6BW98_MARSD|nr:methyl-accepting chemotaxis protein [Maridesulfovibrio salexigens]ACS78342.1 methyl-accepting chemotaxis sensory transducer with Cache sensor [Maridesulfovibrio salexigens DSM 2638]